MDSHFSFLRDLERAATPAPWATHLVDDTTVVANDGATIAETFSEGGRDADVDFFSPVERHEADACFIAAMRNAMPGLIDELDRIERDLASARAENDKLRGLLWFAWSEFNAIRARSGAPLSYDGMTTVDEAWWSQVTDAFRSAIGDDAKPWPSARAHAVLSEIDAALAEKERAK